MIGKHAASGVVEEVEPSDGAQFGAQVGNEKSIEFLRVVAHQPRQVSLPDRFATLEIQRRPQCGEGEHQRESAGGEPLQTPDRPLLFAPHQLIQRHAGQPGDEL